jgi:hypothetical protein
MVHFALCKELQHSQKKVIFDGCGVAEAPQVFQPAGLTTCISLVVLFCTSGIYEW